MIKHIADYKIYRDDFKQTSKRKLSQSVQWKFYSPKISSVKCEEILISDLKLVKDYLKTLEENKKIKIVRNCKDVEDLKHFERRLRFCLGKR